MSVKKMIVSDYANEIISMTSREQRVHYLENEVPPEARSIVRMYVEKEFKRRAEQKRRGRR